ncbi:permease protein of sulfate transporter [Luminiphilus syltensis NOR5-1B]|uniref:Permease protein of sulfate transporter n=1 Tax=Luminiphilus syltensis NOR5-1B TaxID=565045 RepID=B8KQF0_9GAMM|nr:SulP family inorganic anion transporter [Luminiphilus syltensis]EED35959.1 permease protein of sulfate transporter [Luminiphilus syltensis NOR5-1B]
MGVLALNRIDFNHFSGDLRGGVVAAIVALPLALAFGVASGMGPEAGLYGAICVGLMASLFGGTPTQISGPTGPMTIVAAALFTQFGDQPAIAFSVVMMAGLFQMLFGVLRMGRYINLMPYPVISGFLTGIGVVLIFMQLDPLLGFPSAGTVQNAMGRIGEHLESPNFATLGIGALAVAICFFTPARISRRLPPSLIALVVCSLVAMRVADIPSLGPISVTLPDLVPPTIKIGLLGQMLSTALVLAALGAIDSLLTAQAADSATATLHDPDKELVGQGIGNLFAGVMGGIPGAGATIRTLANIEAGGRGVLSGVVHSLVLIAALLMAAPLIATIPNAALAGILLRVGFNVIDWRSLKRIARLPRADQVLMSTSFLLTITVDVVTAAGMGIILASLTFVKQAADIQAESIEAISDPEQLGIFDTESRELFREISPCTRFLYLSGLMSFGVANEMSKRFARLGDYDILMMDLTDVPHIDGSAGLALESAIQRALDANREVFLIGMRYRVARVLGQLGSLDRVKETQRFLSRREALEAAAVMIRAREKS